MRSALNNQAGNMLFIILVAIALFGLLTFAIQSTSRPDGANIDSEQLAIRITEIQRYASELERAVLFIMQNSGVSEVDLRFSHPNAHADYGDLSADSDPFEQVFHRDGGGATYRDPPSDINDGSAWEFYAGTHLPGVGSDRADLIALLPNVTAGFCSQVNKINGQSGTPADTGSGAASGNDPGDCLYLGDLGRFDASRQYYTTVNTGDETTFEQDDAISSARTALQACVVCDDSSRHFYHVLLAR